MDNTVLMNSYIEILQFKKKSFYNPCIYFLIIFIRKMLRKGNWGNQLQSVLPRENPLPVAPLLKTVHLLHLLVQPQNPSWLCSQLLNL